MHLVVSVCPCVRVLSVLSRLNRLTNDLAAKNNKSHYYSKAFVCMSVFRGRLRIIALMRSSGFHFYWEGHLFVGNHLTHLGLLRFLFKD